MKFEEAHQHYLKGNKIRRPTKFWPNEEYYFGKSPCPECAQDLTVDDALADDWEIVE